MIGILFNTLFTILLFITVIMATFALIMITVILASDFKEWLYHRKD